MEHPLRQKNIWLKRGLRETICTTRCKPRLSGLQEYPLHAANLSGVEPQLGFELQIVRLFGVPLRERVQIALGRLEAEEDRLQGCAKGGLARFVGPVNEHDVGIEFELPVAERAE